MVGGLRAPCEAEVSVVWSGGGCRPSVTVCVSSGRITLRDLKRCKLSHIFFDTFFNIEKYLDHEQKDPFSVIRVSLVTTRGRPLLLVFFPSEAGLIT